MSYPSRLFGKIHFLLLAIFLLVSVIVVINQLSYDFYVDFYFDHLSVFDQVIITYQNDMLILANISCLVWLLRVHSALRRLDHLYPINEVEYLLRMALPLVQFWGIASTFIQMSNYFAKNPLIARKSMRIKVMVVFIYISFFAFLPFSFFADDGWGGTVVIYIILAGYMVMYLIFLLTTIWVNQYLYRCVLSPPEQAYTPIPVTTFTSIPTLTTELSANMISSPEGNTYALERVQANIWVRLAAKAIDYIIFLILAIAAIIPGTMNDNSGQVISLLVITCLSWFIYLAIHLSINGQSIGKWLLKLKIVRADTGAEGGFLHNVLLRMITNYIIGLLVPFYSLVDVVFIFTREARCIHDRIASTVVIRVQ